MHVHPARRGRRSRGEHGASIASPRSSPPTGGKVDSDRSRGAAGASRYEIAHQHEGYYVVVRFTAEPSVQPELDRALKLADEVIRHKILLLPDKATGESEDNRFPASARRETTTEGGPPMASDNRDHDRRQPHGRPRAALHGQRRRGGQLPGRVFHAGSATRPATGRTATRRSSRSTAGGAWPRTPPRR